MKKLIFGLVLSMLFVLPILAEDPQNEVIFISNEMELIDAMKADRIKGIAIRSEFYNKTGPVVRAKIEMLIALNLNNLMPLFFYGYDIRADEVKRLFTEKEDYPCKPLIVVGFFGLFNPNDVHMEQGKHVQFCAYGEIYEPGSHEEWFRNSIEEIWREWKAELKRDGYATLN